MRGSTQPGAHIRNGAAHGLTHIASTQVLAAQSAFVRQPPPGGHGAHEPPQSMPVSEPF